MKQWLLKVMVQWALDYLTKENLSKWADAAKAYILPWMRDLKDQLIAALRAEAAKSETKLDDSLVDALSDFLDAFLPDNPKQLS